LQGMKTGRARRVQQRARRRFTPNLRDHYTSRGGILSLIIFLRFCQLVVIDHGRIVKIFELSFPPGVMLLRSPALGLVFRPTIRILTCNVDGKDSGERRWIGRPYLAYITGSVDQHLLLRNEYLVTENRMLRHQIKGA
jgi:hypothetical protein